MMNLSKPKSISYISIIRYLCVGCPLNSLFLADERIRKHAENHVYNSTLCLHLLDYNFRVSYVRSLCDINNNRRKFGS